MNKLKVGVVHTLQRILPGWIRDSIFHLSFHLAPEEFEKFAYDYCFAPSMERGLAVMGSLGFSPKTIIDVGAFEGNWSKLAKRIWPCSTLFMIEPNLNKMPLLNKVARDLDANLIQEVLGADNGRVVNFFVMESGSSIMEEHSSVPRVIEKRELRTLESLLPQVAPPVLLKIDAQGYELEILRGARGLLPNVEAVLLEVAIIEINNGAPLLHDVVAFMKMIGFVAYDILEIHRRPLDRALNQVDIIFIKEDSQLIADKRHFHESP